MHLSSGRFPPVRTAVRQYGRLLGYARRYRRGWLAIFALTLLSTALALMQPWPLKVLVDNVLGGIPLSGFAARVASWLPGADGRTGLLMWVVIAGLLLFALGTTLEIVLTTSWIKTGQRMVYDLSADLFARLQRRSLLFHKRTTVGDSLARVTSDNWVVNTVVDTLLFTPLHALIITTAMLFVMFRVDAQLTWISLAVVPFMAAASFLKGRRIRGAAAVKRQVEVRVQSHVQQILRGIHVVQAFGQEQRENDRLHEHARAAIAASTRTAFIGSSSALLSGLLSTGGIVAVMYVGAHRVLDGVFTVGGLLLFLSYARTLQTHTKAFTGIYAALQSAGPAFDRVIEILETPPEVQTTSAAVDLPRAAGHLSFERVSFSYDQARPILSEITFEARPGQTIAIVGATGAGKSTLAGLVPRFFDPTSGRVLIDGHDVRQVTLSSLRAQVSLVLQDSFLFTVSIAENIRYARPGATLDDIREAARAARADAFIERLPEGYDTVMGQRGATLSGGERQRIAIARAFLKDAPILILDEPTSALDAETEAGLLTALDRLRTGRTTLIIAHRLSTIRNADRVVVLERGRIVESGSPADLMAGAGTFASMYALQQRAAHVPAAAGAS